MTSTSVLRTTVREARPEEAGAVAALVRDGYTAYADELPLDLLRTWVDEVADPGAGPRASAPSSWHRRTAGPAWRAC